MTDQVGERMLPQWALKLQSDGKNKGDLLYWLLEERGQTTFNHPIEAFLFGGYTEARFRWGMYIPGYTADSSIEAFRNALSISASNLAEMKPLGGILMGLPLAFFDVGQGDGLTSFWDYTGPIHASKWTGVVVENLVMDSCFAPFCEFRKVQAKDCSFKNAIFEGATLEGTFTNCDFTGATFVGATLSGTFVNCTFKDTLFTEGTGAATLVNATFKGCTFFNNAWDRIILRDAFFDKCAFRLCNLNIRESIDYYAIFTNCEFNTGTIQIRSWCDKDRLQGCIFEDIVFSAPPISLPPGTSLSDAWRLPDITNCVFKLCAFSDNLALKRLLSGCKVNALFQDTVNFNGLRLDRTNFSGSYFTSNEKASTEFECETCYSAIWADGTAMVKSSGVI